MKKQLLITITFLFSSIISMLPEGEGWGGASFSQTITFQSINQSKYQEYYTDIKQTPDSGYILLADVTDSGYFHYSLLYKIGLKKFDKFGNLQWNKYYTGNVIEGYYAKNEVQPTSDGGYIMTSCNVYGYQPTGTTPDGYIVKVDALGNVQWANSYGTTKGNEPFGSGAESCSFYSIQQTSDGGYIVAGTTSNFGTKGYRGLLGDLSRDIYLLKLNSDGSVAWGKTYGNSGLHERGNEVRQTSDGGYIIAGEAEVIPPGPSCENCQFIGVLIKTNSAGGKLWAKQYTGISYLLDGTDVQGGTFKSVQETSDNGFIAAGGGTLYYPWVVKINTSGEAQWIYCYHSDTDADIKYGEIKQISETQDGGYAFIESNQTFVQGYYRTPVPNPNKALFKIDNVGNLKWTRNFGLNSDATTSSQAFCTTYDSGYALIGKTYSNNATSYFIKTDASGENGTCQNTTIGVRTIPSVFIDDYSFSTRNGYMEQAYVMNAFTYTVNAYLGCINEPINADFFTSKTCVNDSSELINKSTGETYLWNFGDPLSGAKNTSTIKAPKHLFTAEGTYTVTLIAKDSGKNISDTIVKTITIVPSKFLNAGLDVTICTGDSTNLVSSGGTTSFAWSPIASIKKPYSPYTPSTWAIPTLTTQFKISASNGSCYDVDSVIVNVITFPSLMITGNTTICQGIATTLSALGASNYLWSNGGETTNSINVSPNGTITYSVTSYNGACPATVAKTVKVLPTFTIDAGENVTIQLGSRIPLSASSVVIWFPQIGLDCNNCIRPIASPSVTTKYFITYANSNGCATTDSVIVDVYDCNTEIKVTSAFSPNNDGINDILRINDTGCIETFTFTIYNRWGERVFESNSTTVTWDGTYKGQPMDKDVFVYSISGTLLNGNAIEKKGNVSLLR